MPDICDLVLDEHEEFRRRFAELDELRAAGSDVQSLERLWGPLAAKLELHASAEEEVFYPELLRKGSRGEEETADAISDHNDIRDAVRRAESEETGSDSWWSAVDSARQSNSDHMGEEERGAIADLRTSAGADDRHELGARWQDFESRHPAAEGLDTSDKDKDAYLSRHR